ncbi:hypothetical protein D3C87_946260 [compost metagenome]
MDREFQSSMSNADLLTTTSSTSFKCSVCGNMFPVSQETCEVCGHHCTINDCRVMQASNEGY